jgi:hypothetical protein
MFGTDDLACETFGQFLKPRHFSPIDKDRNHANSAAQRRLDLDPNGIEGIIKATPIFCIGARKPASSDDRYQRVTSPHVIG